MRILVVGHKGQLGWELLRRSGGQGMESLGYDLPELDITRAREVCDLVEESRPSHVVNAAAFTAVDLAEEKQREAFAVNRDGVGNLAVACRKSNVPLIHVSTDYVFDGLSDRPYLESDPISPLGVYGLSKAAGEKALVETHEQHVVVRTAWLYGVQGNNFVRTMLRLGKEREQLRVVSDQRGCPTWAGDLAEALLKLILALHTNATPSWGIYHYCGAGVTNWFGFASEIFTIANEYEDYPVEVIPIPTEEFPTPAKRPPYSVLGCSKIEETFGIKPRPWLESLAEMLGELLG